MRSPGTAAKRYQVTFFRCVILGMALWLLLPGSRSKPPKSVHSASATAQILSEPADAFARAFATRKLSFPADHGAHEDFRTEWWYFTGNLHAGDNREFGFQLTLFRHEIDRQASDPAVHSPWRTPRIMLGHFALTDLRTKTFHSFERWSRSVAGIAGIDNDPLKVWLDDWSITLLQEQTPSRWRLRAGQQGIELSLDLVAATPVIAQGDNGLSRKSAAPGNASYYYSVPRLTAGGEVSVEGRTYAVTGTAWLDREWSTSALDREQSGWDWFALQFDDGSTLMYYRLRGHGGGIDAHSAGTYVDRDGHITRLGNSDVEITQTAWWQSPETGITYPQAWHITIPRLDLSASVESRFAGQEWRNLFKYWEGSVRVRGTRRKNTVIGRGYVELTGYELTNEFVRPSD